MKKWGLVLLTMGILLAAANLAVAWSQREPRFVIDAGQVERIELHSVNPDDTLSPEPVPRGDYRLITDRADIELVCSVVSDMFLRAFEMPTADDAWNHHMTVQVRKQRVVFCMTDGTTRMLEGFPGSFVRFDGYWCYASSGKQTGYVPFINLISDVWNNAQRIPAKESKTCPGAT